MGPWYWLRSVKDSYAFSRQFVQMNLSLVSTYSMAFLNKEIILNTFLYYKISATTCFFDTDSMYLSNHFTIDRLRNKVIFKSNRAGLNSEFSFS